MTSKRKTVLIVDDHPAVRESLATRIARSQDLEVCGEASDLREAIAEVERQQPDVAVIDISLKSGSGIELIKRIKVKAPDVQILVWSMHPDSLYAERALRAGAMGYLNKERATSEILRAIRQILAGELYVSPEVANRLMTRSLGHKQPSPATPAELLSNRELEVFELIGQGLGTRDIADRLHLSVHTIETHRQRIKAKLRIEGPTELVRAATQWLLDRAEPA
jgi:DNA-binding NarL/FixJ family response regulator